MYFIGELKIQGFLMVLIFFVEGVWDKRLTPDLSRFLPISRLFVFALQKTAETSFTFLIDTLISLCWI